MIDSLAIWGQRWALDMTDEDLDPAFLVWSTRLRMDTGSMPPGRTVIELEFSGAPPGCCRFWLVDRDGKMEMCRKDPHLEVDLLVTSPLRLFVEAWRGFRDLRRVIRAATFPDSEIRTVARAGDAGPVSSAEFVVGGSSRAASWSSSGTATRRR